MNQTFVGLWSVEKCWKPTFATKGTDDQLSFQCTLSGSLLFYISVSDNAETLTSNITFFFYEEELRLNNQGIKSLANILTLKIKTVSLVIWSD